MLTSEDEIIGIVTLKNIVPGHARIGLIATSAQHKRRGVGEHLWTYAAQLGSKRGNHMLHMATQMTNRNAIALCLKKQGQLRSTDVHLYHAKDI